MDIMACNVAKDFDVFIPPGYVDTLEKPRDGERGLLPTDKSYRFKIVAGEIGEDNLEDFIWKIKASSAMCGHGSTRPFPRPSKRQDVNCSVILAARS